MKLYDLKEGDKIKCEVSDGSRYIVFHRINGMHSYCESEKGNPIHLKAWAELQNYSGEVAFFKGMYELVVDQDPQNLSTEKSVDTKNNCNIM